MKTLWCFNGFITFSVVTNIFLSRWIFGLNGFVLPIFLTLIVTLLFSLYLILVENNVLGSLAAWSASTGIWGVIYDIFPIYCNLMVPLFLVVVILVAKKIADDLKPFPIVPMVLSEAIFGFIIMNLVYEIWVLEYYAPWMDANTLFYFVSRGGR